VDSSIISFNRVVLIHGPPGTGKTTLCKSLANKLSIQLSDRHPHSRLVEINSHSLFSKWFSESGKLVMRMFDEIRRFAASKELVFVLMDEVESLTAERQASISSSEPSDAVRVVNALLTQLDQIKHLPNVLVLATSNFVDAIDDAFVDRADIVRYIGPPPFPGRYQILHTCVKEMIAKNLVVMPSGKLLFTFKVLESVKFSTSENYAVSNLLADVARATEGTSGRRLRKIPFLAFASCSGGGSSVPVEAYLRALKVVACELHGGEGGGVLGASTDAGRAGVGGGGSSAAV
jgi:SpoVK/Ycf46/Vps4 family AAA+-type ATPase